MEDDTVGDDYLLATRETTDMFMTLIVNKLLKEPDHTGAGRATVVRPDGFLFGEGIKAKIKEELLEKCHLHTVVRLPNGVFNPYTGIKTNRLNEQAKDLRASIRGEKDAAKRQPVENQVTELTDRIETLRQQAKEAQAAGDRHDWPIYDLDQKNPR
jgi:hypothetical protein